MIKTYEPCSINKRKDLCGLKVRLHAINTYFFIVRANTSKLKQRLVRKTT